VASVILALAAGIQGCGHAQPATGDRRPDAPVDLDYPEQNCGVNFTVDCRPAPR
jgi:hypothetical protein